MRESLSWESFSEIKIVANGDIERERERAILGC